MKQTSIAQARAYQNLLGDAQNAVARGLTHTANGDLRAAAKAYADAALVLDKAASVRDKVLKS